MTTLEEQARALDAIEEKIALAKRNLQDFLENTKPGKEQTAFEDIKKQLEELDNIDLDALGIDLKEIKNIDDLR
jgi:hypothetical protein